MERLEGGLGMEIGVYFLRIVASGGWETGRIFCFGKMFGWAMKI